MAQNPAEENRSHSHSASPETPKKKRGFAAMDPQKQREIASKGGTAAHQQGKAHEWTSTEAAEAGRKGGKAAHHREPPPPEPQA